MRKSIGLKIENLPEWWVYKIHICCIVIRELALCWLPIFFANLFLSYVTTQFYLVLLQVSLFHRYGEIYNSVETKKGCRKNLHPFFCNIFNSHLTFGLLECVVPCAFAVTIRIAVPKPIACDLHGATAVFTKTFPSSFVSFDPLVLYRADNFQVPKLHSGQVVFQLVLSTTTRARFAGTETIRINRNGKPLMSPPLSS